VGFAKTASAHGATRANRRFGPSENTFRAGCKRLSSQKKVSLHAVDFTHPSQTPEHAVHHALRQIKNVKAVSTEKYCTLLFVGRAFCDRSLLKSERTRAVREAEQSTCGCFLPKVQHVALSAVRWKCERAPL
jgi:Na+-transporting NADH:ubiquinone oxidoreductase subunit NqrA